MGLHLYRRHKQECKAGHAFRSHSTDFDERKRGWTRCECPIIAAGTLNKHFKRVSTGRWEWDDAKNVARGWEDAGDWNAQTTIRPPTPKPPADNPTIRQATDAFFAHRQQRGLAKATEGKYQTFSKQLHAFAQNKGYVYINQFTLQDMGEFYASWPDGKRAKARKLNKLKNFVKFCLRRKWITEDIAIDLDPPQGSSLPAGKSPFTDEELSRIFAACDQIIPIPPGPGCREWSGEDVKDFLYTMLYTGMRISDVATFDISTRLHGNNVFLRMHKTKKELFTWIPDWLVERLRAREATMGPRIFALSKSSSLSVQTERWRLKLAKVFRLAGEFQEKPVPHRMRHTFVRILLEKGIQPHDVAELIGDTEAILRKHYAKWITTRQERLTKILQEAFADKPTPKIVQIPKRA